MSSNSKPKISAKDSLTEPFKRAVTGCLRAIARMPELEVAFAAERPGLQGGKFACWSRRASSRSEMRDCTRTCRFHLAQASLPRSYRASASCSGRTAGARGVRRGRTGARRGDRIATAWRVWQKSLGYAR